MKNTNFSAPAAPFYPPSPFPFFSISPSPLLSLPSPPLSSNYLVFAKKSKKARQFLVGGFVIYTKKCNDFKSQRGFFCPFSCQAKKSKKSKSSSFKKKQLKSLCFHCVFFGNCLKGIFLIKTAKQIVHFNMNPNYF